MRLDIRWPIGLLFVIFGALLAGVGAFSDPGVYRRSLGVNVNLWWGAVMLVFGALMLGFGIRASRRHRRE
jgi:drug/metabolite transporter (DMT)-like permease